MGKPSFISSLFLSAAARKEKKPIGCTCGFIWLFSSSSFNLSLFLPAVSRGANSRGKEGNAKDIVKKLTFYGNSDEVTLIE